MVAIIIIAYCWAFQFYKEHMQEWCLLPYAPLSNQNIKISAPSEIFQKSETWYVGYGRPLLDHL